MRSITKARQFFSIWIALLAVACSEIQPPDQPPAEETEPPTVYVPAGFYVWDSGEVSLHSNFSLMAPGIYEEAVTLVTRYLEVTYPENSCVNDTTAPTDTTTSAPGCQFARPAYTHNGGPYYGNPVTYSLFYGPTVTAVVNQVWVFIPNDLMNFEDPIQVFASIFVDVTYPVGATVSSQLVLLASSRDYSYLPFVDTYYGDFDYFALGRQTLVEPPDFTLAVTSIEQLGVPRYSPASISIPCFPSSAAVTYLYMDNNELHIEIMDGPWNFCGDDYYAIDVFVRGKLRSAALPPNLAMVCTPGVGCAFSP